ncbi:FAD-binding oxidoreductase [Actinoplanes sp. CA-030573]|uniref:FAD-binding oxidoreductase n=1 Tax=Actinoplanes sp. CA-030573 TaxID=3239898 RepID=UPI003D8A24C3
MTYDIIEPGNPDYETARNTLLASGNPACVIRPQTVGDVQGAVREVHGRRLSVRGGGHGFPGFGTNDGGVVIDLRHLDDVEIIDKDRHLVRVGGGATWGTVAAALTPYDLGISSGDTRSVGVGGLTLSGGIGWKVRKYGLALDNLVGAQVVTAAGEVVRADAEENPDLFWALRGGGGNFGIVTAFEFAAHPTTEVLHGKIAFPATEAGSVLEGWAAYLRTAAEDLTSVAALANPFARGPQAPLEIHVVVDGTEPEVLDPIRRLGTVIADDVTVKPYAETLEEGMTPPPGIRLATRNAFVRSGEVRNVLRILTGEAASGRSPILAIRGLGGAVARVPAGTTAYAHRDAELMVVGSAIGPEPVLEATAAARAAFWNRLAPHTAGMYANFVSTAGDEDVAEIYPPSTRARLAAVKRRFDPGNVFAGNHNVRP